MKQDNELPFGWCLTSLGMVADYINGRAFKPTEWGNDGKAIIRIQNLNNHAKEFNYSNTEHEEKYIVKRGDLLFAWSASLGAYIWHGQDAWLNQHIFKVNPYDCINKIFLYYLLTDITAELYRKTHGSGMVHVTKGKFEATEIPLPPLNEQHRIVTEIEKQFSRLDETVSALKRIQANLKRYKASVLKSAVEGKLTAVWREQHPALESAQQLLERILKERRAHWEAAELAKMQANGKTPKDEQWKLKYKEPVKPDISMLPELPAGWCYVSFPQIGELNRGKSKHRPRNDKFLYGGIYPFIQTGDIKNAIGVIKNFTQTYSEEGLKQSKLWQKGTLCITIAANIADTAILGVTACI